MKSSPINGYTSGKVAMAIFVGKYSSYIPPQEKILRVALQYY